MLNLNRTYWENRYEKMSGEQVVGNRVWNNDKYIEENKKWESLFNQILIDINDGNENKTVLDLGCGIGRWIPLLTKFYTNYYGVDIVTVATNESKKILDALNIKNYSLGLIHDGTIPFNTMKFDLIWTCVSLQHIVDDNLLEYYITQFSNMISESGKVMITENIFKTKNNDYIKFRSPKEYISIFKKYGFSPIIQTEIVASREPHTIIVFKKETENG